MASLLAMSKPIRAAARRTSLPSRSFSMTPRLRSAQEPPKPPRSINDSTSALDFKKVQRNRPPPLPAMDLPQSRTAEEAVTNILYNTPPPSLQPFKRHILNCLVQDEPGVLSRVSGILAGRGVNIDSLVVCRTEIRDLSRMCIVLSGQDGVVEQVRRQLEDLVPVWAVLDYTNHRVISRELLLVKVSILGPEYLDEQLQGGPSHDPRFDHRDIAVHLREANHASDASEIGVPPTAPVSEFSPPAAAVAVAQAPHAAPSPAPLTPSELLRLKYQYLNSINTLASQFGAKIVDVSDNTVIVELTAKTNRVEAFLSLLKPFGVLESARTGLMAMPRTPISSAEEDETATEDADVIDASLLPPG